MVLIIGILAAIALPQYQKAVMKSRYTQLMVRVDALKKAGEMFYLESGTYPSDVTELSIDVTQGGVVQNTGATGEAHLGVIFPDSQVCIVNSITSACWIRKNDNTYLLGYYENWANISSSMKGQHMCCAYQTSLENICVSLGGKDRFVAASAPYPVCFVL